MSTIEHEHLAEPTVARRDPAPRLSVVIPCLNEAGTIEECVRRARRALDDDGLTGR